MIQRFCVLHSLDRSELGGKISALAVLGNVRKLCVNAAIVPVPTPVHPQLCCASERSILYNTRSVRQIHEIGGAKGQLPSCLCLNNKDKRRIIQRRALPRNSVIFPDLNTQISPSPAPKLPMSSTGKQNNFAAFARQAAYVPPPDYPTPLSASSSSGGAKASWFPSMSSSSNNTSYQNGGIPTFGESYGGGGGQEEEGLLGRGGSGLNEWETRFGWRVDFEAAVAYLLGPVSGTWSGCA